MTNGPGRHRRRPSHPPDAPVDAYRALVVAIVHRAVRDAGGQCAPPHNSTTAHLQQEARAWLADEAAVREILELGNYESAPVLQRVRQLLSTTGMLEQLVLFTMDITQRR